MSFQAQLVMLLWLPIVLYLFTIYSPRKAVIISFLGGLLFLPQRAGFALPLIPNYEGIVASSYGIIIGILCYDSQRLRDFQLGWLDTPMLIWSICPVFSSLANGLGFYDGINEAITQAVNWGLPYFLGRLYLNNLNGLRELALHIVKGGLIYVPLCLYEARMSPQIHNIFYGYYPHYSGISQSYRLGGYRPMVFMQHGLMVGMWMMMVALVSVWLWKSGTIKTIWTIPIERWAIVLIATFILCRSTGAYGYLLYGLLILFVAKWLHNSLPLVLLILSIFFYIYTASTGVFHSEGIVAVTADVLNPQRAQSLEYRFQNEELLAEHARDKIVFGWGGWGRNRIFEEDWDGIFQDIAITDSLWILAFGINGLVGLVSLTASMVLPVILFGWSGYSVKTWFDSTVAPAAVLAVCLILFMLDSLLNNMFNPIFPLISGGLSGLVLKGKVKVNNNKFRTHRSSLLYHSATSRRNK